MRSLLVLCLLVLTGYLGQAQDIAITNTTCQKIGVSIQAAKIPICNSAYTTTGIYIINPGNTLKLSMYPGGTYPQAGWGPAIVPASQYSSVRVFDPGGSWGSSVYIPCSGGPSAFGASGVGCPIAVTSNWSNPSFIFVNVN